MAIDSLGRIAWSPLVADIGTHSVQVTANDGRGGKASQSFGIIVTADTNAPQVTLLVDGSPADIGSLVTVVITPPFNVKPFTSLQLTENGVAVALDASGRAIIHGNIAGIFTLAATASDAAGNVGSDTQILVIRDPNVTESAPTWWT